MKVLILMLGTGILQIGINGITSAFPSTAANNFSYKQEKTQDKIWNCSSCGHKNYNWTSICGKCGRSEIMKK